jgi:ZIP family zinc transporter
MPDFLIAGGAAFVSGTMLVIGALLSWFVKVPGSVTATIAGCLVGQSSL